MLLALQRLAYVLVLIGMAWPWLLALIADAWFKRKVRTLELKAPNPAVWAGGAALIFWLFWGVLVLLMVPAVPLSLWPAVPMVLGGLIWMMLTHFHRFL